MTFGRTLGSAGLSQGSAAPRRVASGVAAPNNDPVAKLRTKMDSEGKTAAPSRLEALRAELHASRDAGNDMVHAGVVARPMNQNVVARPQEKNLSTMTDQRRQEVSGKGTSVARLGKEIEAQGSTSVGRLGDELRDANNSDIRGTSVARLGQEKTGSSQIGDLG